LTPLGSEVSAGFDRLDGRVDRIKSGMATRTETNALRSEVSARFDRVDKQLEELDKDLTGHMKLHRELEKDIELLKRRPPRTAARAARRR
jgi:hypothetical protein